MNNSSRIFRNSRDIHNGNCIVQRLAFLVLSLLLVHQIQAVGSATLTALTISPDTIDVTSGADTLTVSLSVSDSVGLQDIYLSFLEPAAWSSHSVNSDTWSNFSAGVMDYTGTNEFIIPKGVRSGLWTLYSISFYNTAYQSTYYSADDLQALGFPYEFNVISNWDTIPPVLDSLAISSDTVDVTTVNASIGISISISDENSGVEYANIHCVSPSGHDELNFTYSGISAGTTTYSGTANSMINRFVEAGTWTISRVYMYDDRSNHIHYTTDDLIGMGLPHSFEVISNEDYEGPVLQDFSFSPTQIEYTNRVTIPSDSIQVQISASDDVSGLSYIGVTFSSPISNDYDYETGTVRIYISGSELNFSDSIFVDFQYPPIPPGVWVASIRLVDNDENMRDYSFGTLDSLGFPSRLTIGHGGPAFHVTPLGDDESGDGSVERPFATIQQAIESTRTGDTVMVSDGIYTGEGNRDIHLPSSGLKSITVTSENGPELTILDCQNLGRGFEFSDYHYDQNTVLNGFTIQNGLDTYYGGGIYLSGWHVSPIISNMIIKNCSAQNGGGISMLDFAWDSGIESSPLFINCRIENNSSEVDGGGVYIYDSQDKGGFAPVFVNCTISGNTATGYGGGMFVADAAPIILNSVIAYNQADKGGGLYSRGKYAINVPNYTYITMINNTMASNRSTTQGDGILAYNSQNSILNSIIWDNDLVGDTLNIDYSLVQGGWPGAGNLDSDPLFADSSLGDYSLQAGSPGIDAGNPQVLFLDIDGSRNDMGYLGGRGLFTSFNRYTFDPIGISESGNHFRDKEFSITNLSADSVLIESASFSTENFSLSTAQFPRIIAPFSSDTLSINFHPQVTGENQDSLAIEIADLGVSFIYLQGLGLGESTLYGSIKGILSAAGSPYLIMDHVTINHGDSLIIEPGVELRFTGWYKFTVYGRLRAIGTETDSIIFTHQENTADSLWWGLRFKNGDDGSELRYCRIEYGRAQLSGYGYTSDFRGGGIYISSTALTVSHCTISNNQASWDKGGGIAIVGSSKTPHIVNCVIENSRGQGIACFGSVPKIKNSIIQNNSSSGVYLEAASPVFENVTIRNNAGGIEIASSFEGESAPVFSHCLITGNTTISQGAGIYCEDGDAKPRFINCTIVDNTLSHSGEGAGLYISRSAEIWVINSIIANNTPDGICSNDAYSKTLKVAYSNIQGGYAGIGGNRDSVQWLAGNVDEDPLFVDPNREVYALLENSPAIDTGTHFFVYGNDTIVNLSPEEFSGSAPDMGAFETTLTTVHPGDADNNGVVDAYDVLPIGIFFNQIGAPRTNQGFGWDAVSAIQYLEPAATYADVNGDGVVDERDVIGIGVNWGNTYSAPLQAFSINPEDSSMMNRHRTSFTTLYYSLMGDSEPVQGMKSLLRSVLGIEIPQDYQLLQNYPNPFNPVTTIRYSLPQTSDVVISIYNLKGQIVHQIQSDSQPAGWYQYQWNGTDQSGRQVATGMYFTRLEAGAFSKSIKMVHLK